MEIPKDWIEECAKKLLELSDELAERSFGEMKSIGDECAVEWATACLAAVFGKAEFLGRIGDAAGVSVDVRTAGAKVAEMHPGDTLVIVRGCES